MTQRENANNNYDIVHTKLFDLKAKYGEILVLLTFFRKTVLFWMKLIS